MKILICFILFVTNHIISFGQCSSVAVQISSSDTSYVQLYHAGFFNIPSGFANICEWEVTTLNGEIIYQETTSGDAFEQGLVLFNHSVPLTDSMKATIVITNNIEGIICTMNDTLYWKETEVLPGAFIGNWAVLSGNVGVEEEILSSIELTNKKIELEIFPTLVQDFLQIVGNQEIYNFTILDLNGRNLSSHDNIYNREKVDLSYLPSGIYLIQFWDNKNCEIGIKKFVKY